MFGCSWIGAGRLGLRWAYVVPAERRGVDLDGKIQTSQSPMIVDPELKAAAKTHNIPLTSRTVLCLLIVVLLEENGPQSQHNFPGSDTQAVNSIWGRRTRNIGRPRADGIRAQKKQNILSDSLVEDQSMINGSLPLSRVTLTCSCHTIRTVELSRTLKKAERYLFLKSQQAFTQTLTSTLTSTSLQLHFRITN